MVSLKNLYVGQPVYLNPSGNQARRSTHIVESVITKVGRKYITVGDSRFPLQFFQWDDGTFHQKTDYSADWELYFSKQDILDEREASTLHFKIRSAFSNYGKPKQSLEQMRKIMKILEEN